MNNHFENKKLIVPSKYVIDKRNNFYLFYDYQNHNWIILNEHGKEIIDLISRGFSPNRITEKISIENNIKKEDAEKKFNSFIDYLQKVRFVFFDKYLQIEPSFSANKKSPLSCSVIFYRCNLNCIYCYNKISRNKYEKSFKDMNTNEFIEALNQLINFGVKRIMFSGGEPTLRDDLVKLAEFIKKKDETIYLALITNGTNINTEKAKVFTKLFDLIWVSLDSYKKEEHEKLRGKGTYDKTVEAIKLLVKEKPELLLVNSLVSDYNYKSMEETRRFVLKELEAHRFRMSVFQPFRNIGENNRGIKINQPPFIVNENHNFKYSDLLSPIDIDNIQKENIDEAINPIPPRVHCGVAHGEIALHSNGDIYPCQNLTDENFRCGNILEEGIDNIYNKSPVMNECRNATVHKIEICRDCEFKYICSGGCRAAAYEIYGDIYAHLKLFCSFNKRKALDRLWSSGFVPFEKIDKLKERYSNLQCKVGE